MIIRGPYSGPKVPSTFAVSTTYSASSGTGIQIPDNQNIDAGTSNFTIHWEGSLSDYTTSDPTRIYYKYQNSDNRLLVFIDASGYISVFSRMAAVQLFNVSSTVTIPSIGIEDGQSIKIDVVVTRETASTNGSVALYVNGIQLGASVSITAASTVSLDNSGSLFLQAANVAATGRSAGVLTRAILYNRALSAAEVLDLYKNGIAAADRYGSQTALTSGTLTVGNGYKIDTFVSGDSFTNVGAGSNASGVEFIATGTTPTTWTNSSSLRKIGATLDLNSTGIATGPGLTILDAANGNTATLPASGAAKVSVQK